MAPSEYDYRLTAPRRRRTLIRASALGVTLVLAALIALMTKGPDPELVARRILEEASQGMQAGPLSPQDIRNMTSAVNRASSAAPESSYPRQFSEEFLKRIESEVFELVAARQFDLADRNLSTAAGLWPDSALFAAASLVLQEARFIDEVTHDVLRSAQQLRARDPASNIIPADLVQVSEQFASLAQIVDMTNDEDLILPAYSALLDALIHASEVRINADAPLEAVSLLEAAQRGLQDVGANPAEFRDKEAAIQTSLLEARVEAFVTLGEARLASENLTQPSQDSAAYYFEQVLSLEPNNQQALHGLSTVGDRYADIVGRALEQNELKRGSVYLARLRAFSPDHPSISGLEAQLISAASAQRGPQRRSEDTSRNRAVSAVGSDAESLLWQEVMNDCANNQIQRYIDKYPAGRYIEAAWRRRSQCLGRQR